MLGNLEKQSQHGTRLKERSVKHFRILDTKTLYEVYEFKEEIGHGAYGTVISAIDKQTSRNVAIKIVNKFTVNETGACQLQEVCSEIKILKSVDHPNIVCLERVYESPRKIYMVFEKCTENLKAIFQQEKSFTEKLTKKIIKQIVCAVYYLHKHDIVHRDLKLENILLTDNPTDPTDKYFIKLSDFGLSIVKTGAGIQSMLKEYCGTILFMAPEILLKHAYSELCDVWAIGIMMYLLLYGEYPFYSASEDELTEKICTSAPIFQAVDNVAVSYEAIDLMQCILEKDPAKRITALEILQHPWIVENKVNKKKDVNVLEYMKKWKSEMRILTDDDESEWMSNVTDFTSSRAPARPETANTTSGLQKEEIPANICLTTRNHRLAEMNDDKHCTSSMTSQKAL